MTTTTRYFVSVDSDGNPRPARKVWPVASLKITGTPRADVEAQARRLHAGGGNNGHLPTVGLLVMPNSRRASWGIRFGDPTAHDFPDGSRWEPGVTIGEDGAAPPAGERLATEHSPIELAIGRLLRIASRPFQPGDHEEYDRCRAVIMDGATVPRPDYVPNYVRQRNSGAAGD